ncbi:hypothetical protein B0H17DRAFT_1071141 [Mycena rosella]|uniref:F-box domain-containing protein n=1 Tax=Mycena rosella TaxID=1033263 RepID=A0AAD7DAD0_MYCRO|nr:hypothetical protein B0H17DRAFT_1071141 [Mycena rosella]
MSQLPQELIEAIVEEVEGHSNLTACSLVARAFLRPSQSRLFRTKSLRSGAYFAFDQALEVLNRYPHLAVHLRDLTIDIPNSQSAQAALGAVLRLLPNVERLAVNGNALAWNGLGVLPALAAAILAVISLPSLERLHLLRIHPPSSVLLHAASSVRVLSLDRVVLFGGRDPDIPSHSCSNARLEYLILPHCLATPALLRECDFLLDVRHLQRLAVHVQPSPWDYHRTLIVSSSNHLRHLELDCGDLSFTLNLPPLPVLQTMTLILARSKDDDGYWVLPSGLALTVAALAVAASRLEALTFTVLIPILKIQAPWRHTALPVFDTHDYRDQFPLLRTVHCCVGCVDQYATIQDLYFEVALKRVIRLMEQTLPAPHADGILTFGRSVQRSRLNYMAHLP